MVSASEDILNRMKKGADELVAVKARAHGAKRGKRRFLRKQATEIENRMTILVSDLLDAQRSGKNGAKFEL